MNQQSTPLIGRPLQHVLLIEDAVRDADLIQHQLREAGAVCTFTVSRNLSDALDALRSGRFDLILLDLGLPDNIGLEALHQVREVAPRIPTVILTGRADELLATEALYSGAQDYIIKGHQDPQMLLRAARHAIDRSETIELREAERLKSELLSIVSHEMRTPLTVIRENVSLVLEGALGPVSAEQQEFLTSAVANCDRLRTMIGDLVDTAAIERGALTIVRRSFDLGALLDALVKEYRPVFSSQRQTLSVDLPLPEVPIFGDPNRIRQAIGNLLINAQKFTNPGGEVVLRVRREPGEVLVEIADNGVGIPRNALAHVFEPFVQLGREHGPGLKGAGLGLSIVRHIVERHGGSVRVESEFGRGSTFTVALPIFAEGEELRALFRPGLDNDQDVLAVVRVRPGVSSERGLEVLRRLMEGLRTNFRNAYDEALLLERDELLVLTAPGLVNDARWLQDRLARTFPEDAHLLEWALCPIADAVTSDSVAHLLFGAVVKI